MEITFRGIIQQALDDRMIANSQYSLRSFARDLNAPISSLSEILNGRKGISPKRAVDFARKLRLPEWQTQFFCDLVTKEHSKSPRERKEAALRLKSRKQENHLQLIQHSAMRALTSWVDLAILELTHLKSFEPSSLWVAKKLGIAEKDVRDSLARLTEAKLLEVDKEKGRWIDASPLFSSSDGIQNESIRRFHRTVLNLALKKLESQDMEARTVKSVVFSLSQENRQRAKSILDEAIAKVVALADNGSQKRDDVMCFSAQLFSLLHTKETTK